MTELKTSPEAPQYEQQLDELLSLPSSQLIETLAGINGSFQVLGAGGKMGYHLSLALKRALTTLGRDEPITCISRFNDPRTREKFTSAGLEVISAELSCPDQVRALPAATNILYLAGVKFGTSTAPDLLQRMNVTMPMLVAEHFHESRIVALSSGCVYSFVSTNGKGSKETDSTDPPGDYARSCLGRENAFIEAAERYHTRVALVRLNYSIDLRYGVLVDIARKVFNDEPVELATGYVNVIWQGDAVDHILRSFSIVSSPPKIINVTGQDVLSVREIAIGFGERFGKGVRFKGTEADTAWLNDASHSHELFGIPSTTVSRMMDWVSDWIKHDRPLLDKPTHFENRAGSY